MPSIAPRNRLHLCLLNAIKGLFELTMYRRQKLKLAKIHTSPCQRSMDSGPSPSHTHMPIGLEDVSKLLQERTKLGHKRLLTGLKEVLGLTIWDTEDRWRRDPFDPFTHKMAAS